MAISTTAAIELTFKDNFTEQAYQALQRFRKDIESVSQETSFAI